MNSELLWMQGGNSMKRNEKLVIHGNEFYVIDLDCLEKKRKNMEQCLEKDEKEMRRNRLRRNAKREGIDE